MSCAKDGDKALPQVLFNVTLLLIRDALEHTIGNVPRSKANIADRTRELFRFRMRNQAPSVAIKGVALPRYVGRASE